MGRLRGPIVFAALVLVALLWRVAPSLHQSWLQHPFTHGYLVLGVALWVVYRDRDRWRVPGDSWLPGYLLVAGLSLLWFAGAVTLTIGVHRFVVPALVGAAALAVFGPRAARRLVVPAILVALALPGWSVVTPVLQAMTVAVSTSLLGPLEVNAEIRGNMVHLDQGTLEIAESCAGLSFFMAATAIGTVYAALFLRSRRARVTAVATAAGLAIVGNWIRVTGLIAIADASEMESSLVTDHGTYGWAIFTVGLLGFFALGGPISRLDGRSAEGAEEKVPATTPASGPERTDARLSGRLYRVSALAALGPLLLVAIGALPMSAPATDASALSAPTGWSETPSVTPIADWQPEYAGYRAHLRSAWTDGAVVTHADEFLYWDQSQGNELVFHENRIAEPDHVLAEGVRWLPDARKVVNEAVVRTETGPIVVWHWYRVGDVDTASELKAKGLELWAFLRRRPLSRLVALYARCGQDDCSDAVVGLDRFLSPTAPTPE